MVNEQEVEEFLNSISRTRSNKQITNLIASRFKIPRKNIMVEDMQYMKHVRISFLLRNFNAYIWKHKIGAKYHVCGNRPSIIKEAI